MNEMILAEQLIETTPDSSQTLFDRGFYSLGLLLHSKLRAKTLSEIYPNELSFTLCANVIVSLFEYGFTLISNHYIPNEHDDLTRKAEFFVLPFRREERVYPRQVKKKPCEYTYKK